MNVKTKFSLYQRLCTFIMLLLNHYSRRRTDREERLRFQLAMLQRRLGEKKIIPSTAERKQLLFLIDKCSDAWEEVLSVVTPSAVKRWLRRERQGKEHANVGRKPTPVEIRELVIRLKRENPGWGSKRIQGELAKLDIAIGHMTVKRILKEEFPKPTPGKTPRPPPVVPWRQFLAMHLDCMLGADFLNKRVWSWFRPVDALVLVVIHFESRRIWASAPTLYPNDAWMRQQARNIVLWCQDEGIEPRFLTHDNDVVFNNTGFDQVLKEVGVKAIRTPIQAPNANTHIESWIGKFKAECLNHFICFSLGQLDRIVSSYRHFHNHYRPHQGKGIDNQVLVKGFQSSGKGEIKRLSMLGGLLNHYYRDAG